jgi:hypothetical protein
MARAKWSKSDLPGVGSVAGILLFGLVIGVGTLAELINRRGR